MLKADEFKLLEYLYSHRFEFTTSKALSLHFGVSDRTIRTRLKKLEQILLQKSEGEVLLEIKKGAGFRLKIQDEQTYHKLFASTQNNEVLNPCRITDILLALYLSDSSVSYSQLETKLHISRSTLQNDLVFVREILKKHNLELKSISGKGLCIKGSERNLRKLLSSRVCDKHLLELPGNLLPKSLGLEEIHLHNIVLIVLKQFSLYKISYHDYQLHNLVVHLALAIMRIQKGCVIEPIELNAELYSTELLVAQAICDALSAELKLSIPCEEHAYIALHIAKSTDKPDGTLEESIGVLQDQTSFALNNLDSKYGFSFSTDCNLLEGLSNHLEVLSKRLAHKVHLKNPLLGEIEQEYPYALDIAKSFMEMLPNEVTPKS